MSCKYFLNPVVCLFPFLTVPCCSPNCVWSVESLTSSEESQWAAAAAKSHQSCPTLCDPIDGSPPGSPVPGILQARILEWVAISFSNAWKWKVKVKLLSRVRLLATPWTAAHQAPLSMGFARQEYWSGVPLHVVLSTRKSYPSYFVELISILYIGIIKNTYFLRVTISLKLTI